jgi:hypothetical protein
MRDYARLAPTFWTRGTGKNLRGDKASQVLALYLMSAPAGGITGVFYLSVATIINDTGLSASEVTEGLARLSRERFAAYDKHAEMVWVPGLARHQIGEAMSGTKDKRHASFIRELRQAGSHPFALECLLTYRDTFGLPGGIVDSSVGRWSWGLLPPEGTGGKGLRASGSDRSKACGHQDPIDARHAGIRIRSMQGSDGSGSDRSKACEDQPLLQAHGQAQDQAHGQAQGGTGGSPEAPPPEAPPDERTGESTGLPSDHEPRRPGQDVVDATQSALSGEQRVLTPSDHPDAPTALPGPASAIPEVPPLTLSPEEPKSKRGTRIPPDWKPTVSTAVWCQKLGVDGDAHLDEFRDHWTSVSGKAGVKLDWDATFRNRMRSLIEQGRAKTWDPPRPKIAKASPSEDPAPPLFRKEAIEMMNVILAEKEAKCRAAQ